MNNDDLSYVEFGDTEGLGRFLFENGVQHQLFYEILADQGILVQKYPLIDADTKNLDDWLFVAVLIQPMTIASVRSAYGMKSTWSCSGAKLMFPSILAV